MRQFRGADSDFSARCVYTSSISGRYQSLRPPTAPDLSLGGWSNVRFRHDEMSHPKDIRTHRSWTIRHEMRLLFRGASGRQTAECRPQAVQNEHKHKHAYRHVSFPHVSLILTLLTSTLSVLTPPPSAYPARLLASCSTAACPDTRDTIDTAHHHDSHAESQLKRRLDAHVIRHALIQLILKPSDKLDSPHHTGPVIAQEEWRETGSYAGGIRRRKTGRANHDSFAQRIRRVSRTERTDASKSF